MSRFFSKKDIKEERKKKSQEDDKDHLLFAVIILFIITIIDIIGIVLFIRKLLSERKSDMEKDLIFASDGTHEGQVRERR